MARPGRLKPTTSASSAFTVLTATGRPRCCLRSYSDCVVTWPGKSVRHWSSWFAVSGSRQPPTVSAGQRARCETGVGASGSGRKPYLREWRAWPSAGDGKGLICRSNRCTGACSCWRCSCANWRGADEISSRGMLRVGSAAVPSCRPTRLRCRTQPGYRNCYGVCQRTVRDGPQRHELGPRDELGPHGALPNRAHRNLPNGVQIALPSTIGMSRDDTLISVLGKVEMRQGRAFGFRIITLDGKTVDSLLSSPNEELALGPWSPITGDQRLLVSVRRDGNSHCAVWSPSAHRLQEFGSELPGNVELSWYPNGTEVLVVHHFRGRSNLRCASLAGKGVRDLNTPVGSIASASVRPDGEVWFEWSDGQHAHKVMSDRGTIIRPPSKRLRAGTVYNDFSVGDIHSFVAVPRHKSPYPTVDSCSWRARFSP